MQNLTTNTDSRQPLSPEIYEALKVARVVEYRLASECFDADEELRDELARDLHRVAASIPDDLAGIALDVARDLNDETADFHDWGSRLDASRRINLVTRALEGEPAHPEPEEADDDDLADFFRAINRDDRREVANVF
jgi:hypothetical protein